MKIFFVTGTDTDSGKTYALCQLLAYFNRHGKNALALKPVASGCYEQDGQLQNEDILNLQKYHKDSSYKINKWQFVSPISPHLAAREVNQRINLHELADFCFNKQFQHFDYLFIEGAGGLMAPLNEEETWLDFVLLTKIPLILVVGLRLGCLNHALLTDAVLQQHDVACVGWIANCLDEKMLAKEQNIATLSSRMHSPRLAIIPFQGTLEESDFCL